MKGLQQQQESLWRGFFKDPSKWWDKRSRKTRPGQPDFRHKLTRKPLWIESRDNPSWVRDELIRCGLFVELRSINESENRGDAHALSPSLIWECCKNQDVGRGIQIHSELERRGLLEGPYSDALVCMYAKCGELQKAQSLLDMHKSTNIVSWTAVIATYSQNGKVYKALRCFEQIEHAGVTPNEVTYSCLLKACALAGALNIGTRIHNEISRQGLLENNVVLGGALVDMYSKCSAFEQAELVLQKLPMRNTVCWNALLSGYAQNGRCQKALDCFQQMQSEGIVPNEVTYACICKAHATNGAADQGKVVHNAILTQGHLECDVVLGNVLVDMYAKCGKLHDAQNVLVKLPCRNSVSWGSLIAGYVVNGQDLHALDCFTKMRSEGFFVGQI